MQGNLLSRQLQYVQQWNDIHRSELIENFETLKAEIQSFEKIKPLN